MREERAVCERRKSCMREKKELYMREERAVCERTKGMITLLGKKRSTVKKKLYKKMAANLFYLYLLGFKQF